MKCEKLAEESAGAVMGFAGKPFAFSVSGPNLEERSLRLWTGRLGSEEREDRSDEKALSTFV